MGLPASESRRQVTCSPSSQRILTATALAQTMRPSIPSSVQHTRLPILSVCRLVLVVVEIFFWLLMVLLPVSHTLRSGRRTTALPRHGQDPYLSSRRHIK
jgi:hypothetical protein